MNIHNLKMYSIRTSLIIFLVVCFGLSCKDGNIKRDCKIHNECSCQLTDDKRIIDISSLGNTNKTPRFKDFIGEDGANYSYNPCYPFNDGDCRHAAICRTVSGKKTIGFHNTSKFSFLDDILSVGYRNNDNQSTQLFQVNLRCNETAWEPNLLAAGSKGFSQYVLTMETMCACPDMCNENETISYTRNEVEGEEGGTAGQEKGMIPIPKIIDIVWHVITVFGVIVGVIVYKVKTVPSRVANICPPSAGQSVITTISGSTPELRNPGAQN